MWHSELYYDVFRAIYIPGFNGYMAVRTVTFGPGGTCDLNLLIGSSWAHGRTMDSTPRALNENRTLVPLETGCFTFPIQDLIKTVDTLPWGRHDGKASAWPELSNSHPTTFSNKNTHSLPGRRPPRYTTRQGFSYIWAFTLTLTLF